MALIVLITVLGGICWAVLSASESAGAARDEQLQNRVAELEKNLAILVEKLNRK